MRHLINLCSQSLTLALALTLVGSTGAPLALAGAGGGPPPEYFVDESKLPFTALPGATALWGVHTGAGYRVEVPDNWNGQLVMWAHGFRGTGLELTVDNHPLRGLLIPLGFAWAASSYSRNDYDITTGVQDTHALANRFTGLVGNPSRVYITGASMGGHITGVSIEQYEDTYDAALPICGVLGDYALFDYFLDFNAAASQIGTGSSESPITDEAQWLFVTVPAIKAALEAIPGTWPFTLNSDGQNHKNLTELRSGGERPNFDEAFGFWNSITTASGPGNFLFELAIGDGTVARAPGNIVDNIGVVYQFDGDPALTPDEQDLNDGIVRVAADPQTFQDGLSQVPRITGDINVPVLSLHNLGDLFVPVLNEVEYVQRVEANGKRDLLVQRAIRGVLHCDFTAAEFSTAFLDLVSWVETGVKPAGDDFLDPAAVADPLFGCAFTDGAHLLGTPCP